MSLHTPTYLDSPAIADCQGCRGHILWMGGIYPNVTVGDVMDIGEEVICAEYID